MSEVASTSLERQRHPGQRRGRLVPVGQRGVHFGGGGQRRLGGHVQEGVHHRVHLGDAVQVGLGGLDGGHLAAVDLLGQLGGGQPGELTHASSPRIRGTWNRPCSTGRGAGQRLLLGQPGTDLVGPEHVGQRHRVGGRLDLVSGDLADSGHRGQDDVELAGEPVELGLGDREPGQSGEVGDLGAGDGPAGRVGRRLRHFPPGQEWLEHVPGAKPSITT